MELVFYNFFTSIIIVFISSFVICKNKTIIIVGISSFFICIKILRQPCLVYLHFLFLVQECSLFLQKRNDQFHGILSRNIGFCLKILFKIFLKISIHPLLMRLKRYHKFIHRQMNWIFTLFNIDNNNIKHFIYKFFLCLRYNLIQYSPNSSETILQLWMQRGWNYLWDYNLTTFTLYVPNISL